MGLSHSPRVAIDGLVFYMDSGNDKCYKGPNVKNNLTQITNNDSSGAGKSITSGTETVNIPQLGLSTVKFSSVQNDYPAVSTDCCPSPFTYGNGFTVLPSTLYTYGIVYKVNSGYTHPNFMYRYEYTAFNGTYVTEGGVHNDSNRIHLGDGWYWAWGTFTTQATTNWIGYTGGFYYRSSTVSDKFYVAKIMMIQGNYTQLHPKYWPDVNTTRANTAVFQDMSLNNNTITVGGLTYSNNGSFTFDGVDDYIDCGSTIQLTNNFTLEVWHKNIDTGYIIDQGNIGTDPTGCLEYNNRGLTLSFNNIEAVTATGTFSDTTIWNHVVCTFSSGSVNFYINGKFDSLKTTTTTAFTPGGNILKIGRRAFNTASILSGTLGIVKIYNRVLSETEVLQNFNALRGRFGV